MIECILLIGSDGLAEQTGTNEQKEVGYHDKENRKRWAKPDAQYGTASGLESVLTGSTGECVEHEAADEAADDTDDSGDGDGARRLAEGNTSNEDDGFKALAQYDDKRKCKESPLARASSARSIYERCINTRVQ